MATQQHNPYDNLHMKIIGYLALGLTVGVLATTIWLNHIAIQEHLKENPNV